MPLTTETRQPAQTSGRIRWGRVFAGAVLVEAGLIGLTLPVALLAGTTVFLAVVPPACFGVGFVCAWWACRKIESRFVLHGALIGIIATAIYFGLVLSQPGGMASVMELYGPFLFFLANGLRVIGCVAGGAAAKGPRTAAARDGSPGAE
jgi:hypothetical protein